MQFPEQLRAYRSKPNQLLVVLIDGDNVGVRGRIRQLNQACLQANVPERADGDHALILVPTWNIETWFAYLDGQEVAEEKSDYPRLDRARDCQRHVNKLAKLCQQRSLRAPAPPSLEAACHEYRTRLNP